MAPPATKRTPVAIRVPGTIAKVGGKRARKSMEDENQDFEERNVSHISDPKRKRISTSTTVIGSDTDLDSELVRPTQYNMSTDPKDDRPSSIRRDADNAIDAAWNELKKKDLGLTEENRKLSIQIEQSLTQRRKLKTEVEELTWALEALKKEKQSQGTLKKLRDNIEERGKQVIDLEQKMKSLNNKIEAMEKQLGQERAANITMKEALVGPVQDRNQVSDDVLMNEMKQLACKVQEFAHSIKRKTSDLHDKQVAGVLEELPAQLRVTIQQAIPDFVAHSRGSFGPFVRAIIAAQIVMTFGDASLVPAICPREQAVALNSQMLELSKTNGNLDDFNQWRTTMSRCLYNKSEGEIEDATRALCGKMSTTLAKLVSSIAGVSMEKLSLESLDSIFLDAIRLSRRLLLQRCRYRVEFPKETSYHASCMDDHFGNTVLEHTEKPFDLIVFPALVKTADAHGKTLSPPSIISKASVFWTAAEPHQADSKVGQSHECSLVEADRMLMGTEQSDNNLQEEGPPMAAMKNKTSAGFHDLSNYSPDTTWSVEKVTGAMPLEQSTSQTTSMTTALSECASTEARLIEDKSQDIIMPTHASQDDVPNQKEVSKTETKDGSLESKPPKEETTGHQQDAGQEMTHVLDKPHDSTDVQVEVPEDVPMGHGQSTKMVLDEPQDNTGARVQGSEIAHVNHDQSLVTIKYEFHSGDNLADGTRPTNSDA